jgi:HEAT repeat protein
MENHPHTRLATTGALSQIGGPAARAAVPFLKQLLKTPDELLRVRAAQALWQLECQADQVVPVLIQLLQPGGQSRSHAAEVLGGMGEAARQAVPALRGCLDDRSFLAMWVRFQATRALWRIERNTEASLPVLLALVRDCRKAGVLVATQAAETLGEMGASAQEAVPGLRAALADDVRPFGGIVDDLVILDDEFCSAVSLALRRIEEDR